MKKILFAVAVMLSFAAFEAKALDLVGMAQKAQNKVDAATADVEAKKAEANAKVEAKKAEAAKKKAEQDAKAAEKKAKQEEAKDRKSVV